MNRSTLFLSLALALVGTASHAVSFTIVPGNYVEEKSDYLYGPQTKGRFELRQKGPQIRLIDTVQDIVYSLDLTSDKEQPLPQKYIEFLHDDKLIGKVRHTIEAITVKVTGQGKSKNQIEGVVSIYMKFKVLGAEVKMKTSINMTATAGTKSYSRYDNGQQNMVDLNNIKLKSSKIWVANLKTILPDSADEYSAQLISKLIGYITDTGPLVDTELHATK